MVVVDVLCTGGGDEAMFQCRSSRKLSQAAATTTHSRHQRKERKGGQNKYTTPLRNISSNNNRTTSNDDGDYDCDPSPYPVSVQTLLIVGHCRVVDGSSGAASV